MIISVVLFLTPMFMTLNSGFLHNSPPALYQHTTSSVPEIHNEEGIITLPKTNGWIPKMMGLGKGGSF